MIGKRKAKDTSAELKHSLEGATAVYPSPKPEDIKASEDKNKQRIKIMRGLGTLFIILGLLGILLPYFNSFLLKRNSDIDISKITPQEMRAHAKNSSPVPFEDIAEIGHFDFWPLLGKWKTEDIVGELIIPDLDIQLAIFNNARNESILAGVGKLLPERQPDAGNYVLTGHHVHGEGVLLHNLMEAELGSKIYVTNKENVYVYEIVDTQQKDIDALEMLDANRAENYNAEAIISIMTCYKGKISSRWFVIGVLKSVEKYEDVDFTALLNHKTAA